MGPDCRGDGSEERKADWVSRLDMRWASLVRTVV